MNEAYEKIKNRLLEYKKKNYIVPTEKMIKTKGARVVCRK